MLEANGKHFSSRNNVDTVMKNGWYNQSNDKSYQCKDYEDELFILVFLLLQ